MKTIKSTLITVSLVSIGCITMVGDLLGVEKLKGLGLATHASPAPKVFTTQQGFETFSPQFHLSWANESGDRDQLTLSRDVYNNLNGPYNRRNAYGAAISYAPVLAANENTKAMLASVSRYAFCRENNLIHELTTDAVNATSDPRITLTPRPPQELALRETKWQLEFAIDCNSEDEI